MNKESIKKGLAKTKEFITLKGSFNFKRMFIFYLIIIIISYLFSFLIFKNFSLIESTLGILKYLWIIPFYHVMICLVSIKKDVFSKLIDNIFVSIKNVLFKKYNPYRIEYVTLIALILGYSVTSYLLFRVIDDLYIGNIAAVLIVFILFFILKLLFVYTLTDFISLTKDFFKKNLTLLLPIILSDPIFLLLRILFENNNFSSSFRTSFMNLYSSIGIPFYYVLMGILVLGFFIFIYKQKFKIEIEDQPFIKNIFLIFILGFVFSFFIYLFLNDVKSNTNFRFSVSQTIYLYKEIIVIFLIIGIFISFSRKVYYLFEEAVEYDDDSNGKIIKLTGTFSGYSNYSYKTAIGNFPYEKNLDFIRLKVKSKEYNLTKPKRNIINDIDLIFYPGDQVEIYGFFTKNIDLNKNVSLEHFVPLVMRYKSRSKIRKIV